MVSKIKKEFSNEETSLLIDKTISNYDDGELFVEEVVSENLLFDDMFEYTVLGYKKGSKMF